jgi:hypothetical protein
VTSSEKVALHLTTAEALVLFEWLTRMGASGGIVVADPAEEQVLWRLEGQLESALTEPLGGQYQQAVEAARREVRGSQE